VPSLKLETTSIALIKYVFFLYSSLSTIPILIFEKLSALERFEKAILNNVAKSIGNNRVQNIVCLSLTIHLSLYR
jgi:hypothetical protein